MSAEYYRGLYYESSEAEKAQAVRLGLKHIGWSNKYREQERFMLDNPQCYEGSYGWDISDAHVYIWEN